MKIAFFTDVHANLPALEAVLDDIRAQHCDQIYFGGDAIGIGPFPAEVLARLAEAQVIPMMGNHDAWYAFGLPPLADVHMVAGEARHCHWVHACLAGQWQNWVASWPYFVQLQVAGVRIGFAHYALKPQPDSQGHPMFERFRVAPSAQELDVLFASLLDQTPLDLLFYGHHHAASAILGRTYYLNPGALGCSAQAEARYYLLDISDQGTYHLVHRAVPYDDTVLVQAFEDRQVPEREFIRKAFFLGALEQ